MGRRRGPYRRDLARHLDWGGMADGLEVDVARSHELDQVGRQRVEGWRSQSGRAGGLLVDQTLARREGHRYVAVCVPDQRCVPPARRSSQAAPPAPPPPNRRPAACTAQSTASASILMTIVHLSGHSYTQHTVLLSIKPRDVKLYHLSMAWICIKKLKMNPLPQAPPPPVRVQPKKWVTEGSDYGTPSCNVNIVSSALVKIGAVRTPGGIPDTEGKSGTRRDRDH